VSKSPARVGYAGESPLDISERGLLTGTAAIPRTRTLGAIDGYARQTLRVADAHTSVLPSTSGAAGGFWDIEVWRALAAAIDSRLPLPPAESLRGETGRLERG
jgi:hypothetical protein